MNDNFTEQFDAVIKRLFGEGGVPSTLAVGVSGGADSMALLHVLAEALPKVQIYALSVDHRLREEAAEEARFVGEVASKLPNVSHHILVWEDGSAQETRIEECAREARYGLLYDFMGERGLSHLFIAHHQNDQAETFLFRLAKGSGLDGLSCMSEITQVGNFTLCRPFLGFLKAEILDYVSQVNIPYIEDPSNQDEGFARVRLRNSMAVLSKEGLTSKRLYRTASRLSRVRDAIGYMVDKEYKNSFKTQESMRIVLDYRRLEKLPFEIVLRIILKSMRELKGEAHGYGPRLLRVENLCEDLLAPDFFRKRTLGGVVFERLDKSGDVVLALEGKWNT